MSETMKAALNAALDYHTRHETQSPEEVLAVAKLFHDGLVTAAPGATEDWDESWYSRVNAWVRALSGDQRGSVESALRNSAPVQVAPLAYGYAHAGPPQVPAYQPSPPAPGTVPEAWALLDKLNGPQPYPGTAAPIGPLVTRDELEQRLAEFGGDPRSAGDVAAAASSWRDRTLAPEPAAISEALGRQRDETILAAAERVVTELAAANDKIQQLEGNSLALPYPQILAAINETLGRRTDEAPTAAATRVMRERTDFQVRAERAEAALREAGR